MPSDAQLYRVTYINRSTGTVTLRATNPPWMSRTIDVGREAVYNYDIGMDLSAGAVDDVISYPRYITRQAIDNPSWTGRQAGRGTRLNWAEVGLAAPSTVWNHQSQDFIAELDQSIDFVRNNQNFLRNSRSWIDAFLPATRMPVLSIEHIKAWGDKWTNMWARVAEGHELRVYCKEIQLKDGKFVELQASAQQS